MIQRTNGPLLVSAAAALLSGAGWSAAAAQDRPPPEVIVIIGTPGGGGTDRQAASFAVTTIDPVDITRFAPKSTADLLKTIPGVWTESSGGVAGANIDVRGLPGGSDAPFVTLAINGSPLYGTETLSFFEQTTLFRVDETIQSVEGLRGGPNAVFGKGEPGLTVNFNLKEGSEDTEGLLKYTTSDFGLQRVDAVMSGALTDDLFYMVGGYLTSSSGIRDTEFKSEEGQQITVNLTKDFDNGQVNVFARVTDDHGQWVLPFALNTGNDLGEFAQLGNATRFRELQVNAAGDREVFDFADGRGWDGVVAGGSAEFDLGGGFTVRDQLTFTSGDANTFGFVPDGSPVTVADLSAVIGGPVVTTGGLTLEDEAFVQTYRHWVVLKELHAIINDLSVNKIFFDTHDVTAGYYQATWSSDDRWHLAAGIPVHNVSNGDTLDAAITLDDIAAAGGGASEAFGLVDGGDARSDALYIADSWQVLEQLRIDAGVRHEWIDLDFVADTGPGFADGVRDVLTDIEESEWAYTAAANYDINDDLGLFVRYSDGFAFPNFDRIRENQTAIFDVEQIEGGVKYSDELFDVYATIFHNTTDSFSSVVGGQVPASAFTTEATGLEIDGGLTYGPFTARLIATVQDTEITESTTPTDVGNQVLRQPDWQVRPTAAYTYLGSGFDVTVYGAVQLVGERFGDNANTITLDSYEKLDLGVQIDTDAGLFFQVHGDNVTDEEGLTEGDPRDPTAANGRAIFGRSVRVSVGYNF